MFNLYKKERIALIAISILGSAAIIVLPLVHFLLNIILSFVWFLIIQIMSLVFLYKQLKFLDEKFYACNFIELKNKLEKIDRENNKSLVKIFSRNRLFQCYCCLHDKDNIEKVVNTVETFYGNKKDSIAKINIYFWLTKYYMEIEEVEKVKYLQNETEKMLKVVNLDYNQDDKKEILSKYESLRYEISFIEKQENKNTLKNAEKHFLDVFNDQKLVNKIYSADQLVTIYEKLGNQEKAKEYAKFLIENHKDYYINPKRIEKYSK